MSRRRYVFIASGKQRTGLSDAGTDVKTLGLRTASEAQRWNAHYSIRNVADLVHLI